MKTNFKCANCAFELVELRVVGHCVCCEQNLLKAQSGIVTMMPLLCPSGMQWTRDMLTGMSSRSRKHSWAAYTLPFSWPSRTVQENHKDGSSSVTHALLGF